MRKITSFLLLMFAVLAVNAETVYFKNTKSYTKVYAYCWGGEAGGALGGWPGTEMTAVDGHDGWFSIAIPTEVDGNIIFNCGQGGDGNQTADLVLDAANVYYNGSAWQSSFEGGGGTVIEPGNGDYYLVGYINGADYGIEADHENLGDYHFVDGKLTANFTAASYVMVKTSDNANWYMADAYMELEEGTAAVFKNTQLGAKEKVKVPGGVTLYFVLTEQEDGSLLLSYTKGGTTVLETISDVSYTLQDGVLTLDLPSEQSIRLFAVSGNMIDSAVTATYTRCLAQGVYFLRIGKLTQKIVVF